jgi:hypothetical protein
MRKGTGSTADSPTVHPRERQEEAEEGWSKARWEAEWEATLRAQDASALDVADEDGEDEKRRALPCAPRGLLPLPTPSLLARVWRLFVRRSVRTAASSSPTTLALDEKRERGAGGEGRRGRGSLVRLGLAVVGAFCAGIGIGMLMRRVGARQIAW